MVRMIKHFVYGAAVGLVLFEIVNGPTGTLTGIVHSGLSIAQGAALYEMTKDGNFMRSLLTTREPGTDS